MDNDIGTIKVKDSIPMEAAIPTKKYVKVTADGPQVRDLPHFPSFHEFKWINEGWIPYERYAEDLHNKEVQAKIEAEKAEREKQKAVEVKPAPKPKTEKK